MSGIDVCIYTMAICFVILHVLFFLAPRGGRLHRFAHAVLQGFWYLAGVLAAVTVFVLFVVLLINVLLWPYR